MDGKPDDSYRQECYPDIINEEIPCAGCGEWVLLDVPGVDMDEIFPVRDPGYVIQFGKYKGKSIEEIYRIDAQYIYWLIEQDRYFWVDFHTLLNSPTDSPKYETILRKEYDRVFPKVTADSLITFGKYTGKTYREVYREDPNYIEWFVRNNERIRLDTDSFTQLFATK